MVLLKDFFDNRQDDPAKGVMQKNILLKRSIVASLARHGHSSLADLARELCISVPTATKLVGELVDENIIVDEGKVETLGGRRPNIFALAGGAIYFAGVDLGHDNIGYIITDLQNNIVVGHKEEFTLSDNEECMVAACNKINSFLNNCAARRGKIIGLGVSIAGRVDTNTGRSYRYFSSSDKPFRDVLSETTGIRTILENDTRARCYAEYFSRYGDGVKNMLYLHLGRGVAVGIIADGKLYYGKSGFAGEFGHTPLFANEKICVCGKKGCLETEVSGMAMEEKMVEEIRGGVNTVLREKYDNGEQIDIEDIIDAAHADDNLAIELIEEAGEKAGKSLAMLINIFNPELVVIGGNLSRAGDYLMLPLMAATNKYSLNLVYKDTRFVLSGIGSDSGAMGAAMLIRDRSIGL